jgi:hypothetical protein
MSPLGSTGKLVSRRVTSSVTIRLPAGSAADGRNSMSVTRPAPSAESGELTRRAPTQVGAGVGVAVSVGTDGSGVGLAVGAPPAAVGVGVGVGGLWTSGNWPSTRSQISMRFRPPVANRPAVTGVMALYSASVGPTMQLVGSAGRVPSAAIS